MLLLNTESIINSFRTDSADSAETSGCAGYTMMIHHHPVVMVSPLDIQTYILRLPALNHKRREEAIRLQLRTLYPGDTSSAEIDYFLAAGQHDQGSTRRVVVFLADKIASAEYRDKKTHLIPGIALMMVAVKKFPPETNKESPEQAPGY
jgi:hypothetical protein